MKNTEYNQALIKKAQAGLVRFQKLAGSSATGFDWSTGSTMPQNVDQLETGVRPAAVDPAQVDLDSVKTDGSYQLNATPKLTPDKTPKSSNPYLQYAAGGAGVGALVGALINLVRNKSLLSGALGGALIGGGLGAGHQVLRDKVEGYKDNNFIDPLVTKGKSWYNDTFGQNV